MGATLRSRFSSPMALELAFIAVGDSSTAKLSGVGAIADDRNILQMRRQASKQASTHAYRQIDRQAGGPILSE